MRIDRLASSDCREMSHASRGISAALTSHRVGPDRGDVPCRAVRPDWLTGRPTSELTALIWLTGLTVVRAHATARLLACVQT